MLTLPYVAHVAEWEPYAYITYVLCMMAQDMFHTYPALDRYYADLAQRLQTAGRGLDDLDDLDDVDGLHDIDDLDDLDYLDDQDYVDDVDDVDYVDGVAGVDVDD